MPNKLRILAAGAALTVVTVVPLYGVAGANFGLLESPMSGALVGILAGLVALGLCFAVLHWAGKLASWFSRDVLVVILTSAAALVLLREYVVGWPAALLPGLFGVALGTPFLLGCGLALLFRPRRQRHRILGSFGVLGGAALGVWGITWLMSPGEDPFPRNPLAQPDARVAVLEDPADHGDYEFTLLTYGSGDDRRRPEFGEDVDIPSRSVDLSPVLPEWRGFRATHREWWWGFGIERAPVNGRLHLPDVESGDRRPLALIVHGNHRMDDFSDDGYGYINELLASHGIAAVSVDANFLNGTWSGDFGGREMPARAILLLEHLHQLREWARNPRTPVFNRLDFDRVALLGHSRGGEAAAIAAAFNELGRFPDDARYEFDYRFGIEAVVAIAQIDRRYSRRIELEDVHFLAVHGSYDTDEPSYHGLRQFHRVRLSPATAPAGEAEEGAADQAGLSYRIKAGVLAHRANHGQFNSTWGMDSGFPGHYWLNRAPLLRAWEQQRIAAVYISAFLRATLLGEERFVPLLQDYRAGLAHLPETLYQSQYSDSRTGTVADFREDLDLSTATLPDAVIEASGFARWTEEEVFFRDGSKQGDSAARLTIGNTGDEDPTYEIRFAEPLDVSEEDELSLAIAWDPARPEPPPEGGWARPSLAMTVQFVMGDDTSGSPVAVASVRSPEPPFQVRFLKPEGLNRERYRRDIEWIPQTVLIGVAGLLPPAPETTNPPQAIPPVVPRTVPLRSIRFRFDRRVPGEVLLQEVALRRAASPVGG